MQLEIASMITEERIAISPTTIPELQSLRHALRTGRGTQRARACRHLFFASLSFEERLDLLFRAIIVPAVEARSISARMRNPMAKFCRAATRPTTAEPPRPETAQEKRLRMRRLHPGIPVPCAEMGPPWTNVWERLACIPEAEGA